MQSSDIAMNLQLRRIVFSAIVTLLFVPCVLAQTIVLDENFDNGLPPGWSIVDGDDDGFTWEWSSDGPPFPNRPPSEAHVQAPFMLSDSVTAGPDYVLNEELISPSLNFTESERVTLRFGLAFASFSLNDYLTVDVQAGGGPWVTATRIDPLPNPGQGPVLEQTVNLDISAQAAGKDNVRFRFFHHNAIEEWYIAIDNVKVTTGEDESVAYRFEKMQPGLPQPWYFNRPTQVTVTGLGTAYVWSLDRLYKLGVDGNVIKTISYETIGLTPPSTNPSDAPEPLAEDSAGFLYVADSGSIKIVSPSGETVLDEVEGGSPFADHNGLVYVLNEGFIKRYLPGGIRDDSFLRAVPPEPFHDYAFDVNGLMYTIDSGNRIRKYDRNGDLDIDWHVDAFFGSGLNYINVDRQGNVYAYIWGFQIGYILAGFDANGVEQGNIYGGGSSAAPGDFGVSAAGNIYVADPGNFPGSQNGYPGESESVEIFTPTVELQSAWQSYGDDLGYFIRPFGLAVAPGGVLYATDSGNGRIQRFSADGTFIDESPFLGGISSDGTGLRDVTLDSQGRIYVSFWTVPIGGGHHSTDITIYDADWTPLHTWGTGLLQGPPIDPVFNYPEQLAVYENGPEYPDGSVFVTDAIHDQLLVLNIATEEVLEEFGPFPTVSAVALDADKNIYVGYDRYVEKLAPDGTSLAKWGPFLLGSGVRGDTAGAFRIALQKSFAVGEDPGSPDLYLALRGSNGAIVIDQTSGVVEQLGGVSGIGPGQFKDVTGIAVDSNNNIYVSEAENHRIQKFARTTATTKTKAIVVAGGGPYRTNNLWDATQYCANDAAVWILPQKLPEESVYYLSPSQDQDLNEDGLPDADADPTKAYLEDAIVNWASDAEQLVLYLVDHGGPEGFRLNENETLSKQELATWLGQWQSGDKEIFVVYDACNAETFVDALQGQNRVIIASSESDQQAFFTGTGLKSFSNFFWRSVRDGATIREAFESADRSLLTVKNPGAPKALQERVQQPVMIAMPDTLADREIGLPIGTLGEVPIIEAFEANPIGNSTSLTATVSDPDIADSVERDGVAAVWVDIDPPDLEVVSLSTDNARIGLSRVNLLHTTGKNWEVVSNVFTSPGTYQVTFYARDANGNIAEAKPTTLDVSDPNRSRAVLIGTSDGVTASASAVQGLMDLAFLALRQQSYQITDIQYLSTSEISSQFRNGAPTRAVVEGALGAPDTRDLVVYLVGAGSVDSFPLADGDVSPGELESWLPNLGDDSLVSLVLDFEGSGVFAKGIAPAKLAAERIVIASTNGGPASFREEGRISFSQYFWEPIRTGANVGRAWNTATSFITAMKYDQYPQIDDNNNRIFNEPGLDLLLAGNRRFGQGVLLADVAPIVNGLEVLPGAEFMNRGDTALIRATNVTSTASSGDMLNVYATVASPGPGGAVERLQVVPLTDPGDGVYKGTTSPLNWIGQYEVNVLAADEKNRISFSRRTTIRQVGSGGPDDYEIDNTPQEARWVGIGARAETHNFHDRGQGMSADEDWVIFYAKADPDGSVDPIAIETVNLGPDSDTFIEVYFEEDLAANGFVVDVTTPVASSDNAGDDLPGFMVPCDSNDPEQRRSVIPGGFARTRTGLYFVRVFHAGGTCTGGVTSGPQTYYDLRIFREIGECTGLEIPATMIVSVKGDGLLQLGQNGEKVKLMLEGPTEPLPLLDSPSSDEITFPQIPGLDDGNYTLTIQAPGFEDKVTLVMGLDCGCVEDIDIELTPMPVPTDVNATPGTGDGTINLSWTAVDGATSYRIFYSPSTAGSPASGADVGNVTSQTISQLTPGTSYNFQIVAVTPSGESLLSESDSATATGGGPVPPDPPCTGCNCPTKSAIEFLRLSIHEEVLPYDVESVEGATIGANQAIAVRVISGVAVQPDTVWISVEGSQGYAAVDNAWRPTTPGDHRDGWIVFEPTTAYANGERLFVSAGARYEDGTEFGPVTYVFDVDASKIEASLDPYIDETEIDEPMPNTLAQPVSVPYNLGPLGVFADPMTIRLPVPEGYTPDELAIYYYSDSERHPGWYPATGVVGLLAEGSRQTTFIDGVTYIEFTIHHGGRVQLGIPIQTQLATLAPLFVALLLIAIFQFTWKRRRTFTNGIKRSKVTD